MPIVDVVSKRIIPVADYTGLYLLKEPQLNEWALFDTSDMLDQQYDNHWCTYTIFNSTAKAGLEEIDFSGESLSCKGLKKVIRFLQICGHTKSLMVYRARI